VKALRWKALVPLVAMLLAASTLVAGTAEADSGTYSCNVTVGSDPAYYDASTTTVPHAVGGCLLKTLATGSHIQASTSTAPECRVMADTDGDGTLETPASVGMNFAAGTELWARCTPGAANATVSITLGNGSTSTPIHLKSIEPFSVTATDGTTLRGHVYLPSNSGPLGTVLEFSPYWNTEYGHSEAQDTTINGRRTIKTWLQPFLDAGFAVAMVNMRGTGESSGCMPWGTGPDITDTALVVQSLAGKSWSNGNVGMFGVSYAGWSQYMAIASGASALKAVIPISPVVDEWGLLTRNGARLILAPALSAAWTGGAAGGAFFTFGPTTDKGVFVSDTSPDHLACPRYLEDTQAHVQLGLDGEKRPYFQDRDFLDDITGTTVPVFAANGLTFNEGSITQFEGVWQAAAGDKRLLVGQWGHGIPTHPDFNDMAVGWMDRYLRSGPTTVTPGVAEYQDKDGVWHSASSWPPVNPTTPVHLSDGTLTGTASAVTASQRAFQSSGVGHLRQCNTPDYIRYISPPMQNNVLLAGNMEVDVTFSSDLPEGNLVVHVWETDGNGTCLDTHTEVTRAMSTLRHSLTPGTGRSVGINQDLPATYKSIPFSYQLHAGRRLVVTISGDSADILPDFRRARVVIKTGAGITGSINLPVVSGTLAF
jgi:predicted acyl esterase